MRDQLRRQLLNLEFGGDTMSLEQLQLELFKSATLRSMIDIGKLYNIMMHRINRNGSQTVQGYLEELKMELIAIRDADTDLIDFLTDDDVEGAL
jgi:hypothetical protein